MFGKCSSVQSMNIACLPLSAATSPEVSRTACLDWAQFFFEVASHSEFQQWEMWQDVHYALLSTTPTHIILTNDSGRTILLTRAVEQEINNYFARSMRSETSGICTANLCIVHLDSDNSATHQIKTAETVEWIQMGVRRRNCNTAHSYMLEKCRNSVR